MVNLLGDLWFDERTRAREPDWAAVLRQPQAKLHLYGKAEAAARAQDGTRDLPRRRRSTEALATAREIKRALRIPGVEALYWPRRASCPGLRGSIESMEFKDYYQALGVAKTASSDEIKKAYRKLARKYHPDVSKETDAQGRMQQVNEAYAVLSDPEKRSAYDALSRRYEAGKDFEPPPNWDAGFEFSADGPQGEDFSDFFASLFGRGARASRPGRDHRAGEPAMRGEDHHAKIEIDLRDAYRGGERAITLRAAATRRARATW